MAKNDTYIVDDKGNFSDWIELYNSSDAEVSLSGYYLTDNFDTLNMWKIPTGTVIPAKGYLIFWASGDNKGRHTNFSLSVTGEKIALVMPDGKTLVDTVKFPEQISDISYGRTTDGAKNWIYFEEPTPNKANGKPKSASLPVVINELMASNSKTIKDETGAYPDWIELYNNSNETIDISGFYLTDKPYKNPSMWRIPNGTKIPPRGFLLVWADSDPKDGIYHTNFNLSKDGDSIAIYSVDGQTLVDIVVFSKQQTDISWGRKPDGASEWIFFNTATPGKTNNGSNVMDNNKISIINYPNPFNEETFFKINMQNNCEVTIYVYDVTGNEVFRKYYGFFSAGIYEIEFDRKNLSDGIYFYSVKFGDYTKSGKLIIMSY
jgi:hypothetical protein